jgi:hypothetical protein
MEMKKAMRCFWPLIILFVVLASARTPGVAESGVPLPGIDFLSFSRCAGFNCAEIELAALAAKVGMPVEPLEIVLFYNGRQVAVLGKASKVARLAERVKIALPDDPLNAIAKGNGFAAGFQLRLVNGAGQVVLMKNIGMKLR